MLQPTLKRLTERPTTQPPLPQCPNTTSSATTAPPPTTHQAATQPAQQPTTQSAGQPPTAAQSSLTGVRRSTPVVRNSGRLELTCCAGDLANWYKEPEFDLPSGVRQDGARLIFDSWSASYAGKYTCIVIEGEDISIGEAVIEQNGPLALVSAQDSC